MAGMREKIVVAVRCEKLKDTDAFSKSDPFVVITDTKTKREVGRTEVQKDTLAPAFEKMISIDYYFETKQEMKVSVWDFDKDQDHELLGEATFTVGQLMSSRNCTLTLPLAPQGVATVTGMHEGQIKGSLKGLRFRGINLRNMDTLGKSDCCFVLSRVLPGGQTQQLYKSETVDDNLNPLWKPLPPLDLTTVCGGDLNAKVLKFECYDEDVTENEYMGEFVVSVNELLAAQAQHRLVHKKDPSDFYGVISLAEGTLSIMPNFLDLLKKGLQLNIAFAIDFTGSNLEVTNPRSLHYHHPTQPNQYIQAMIAVSDVVQEYDSDKQFAAFGFGAVLPGEHAANHFFHLSLGPNPYLPGMQAVINTYVQTSQVVRFYGPTNFAPTISSVANGARGAAGVYTILLILTDGEITDLNDTIDEIVKADDAPLSILIVGVGQADFGSMSALDSDNAMLRSSTGRVARRDLVQFVPMRDFVNRSAADLAAELLAEIPDQVGKWAEMNPAAVAAFAAAAGAQRPAGAGTNV